MSTGFLAYPQNVPRANNDLPSIPAAQNRFKIQWIPIGNIYRILAHRRVPDCLSDQMPPIDPFVSEVLIACSSPAVCHTLVTRATFLNIVPFLSDILRCIQIQRRGVLSGDLHRSSPICQCEDTWHMECLHRILSVR
jgi:hypothetical protein